MIQSDEDREKAKNTPPFFENYGQAQNELETWYLEALSRGSYPLPKVIDEEGDDVAVRVQVINKRIQESKSIRFDSVKMELISDGVPVTMVN